MSRKDVQDYYNQLTEDYHEMVMTLKDMEKECEEGLVSPDRVEQLKQLIEPIKTNYSRISYIIFLLNKPNKKEKQRWYAKENSNKAFVTEATLDGVRQENKHALQKAKNII